MNRFELIRQRIKDNKLNIDSIYIEQNNNLTKIIDSDKLHELRSCSKLLISLAVGIAIDNKLFELDEKVYEYIKEYVTEEDNIPKIKCWTLKNLLTHTTGYDVMLMSNKEIKEKNLDKNNLLPYILNYKLNNDVGTKFVYNNVEPFIISVIFKKKYNIDIKDFIKEHIFEKLNIKDFEWDNYGEFCPGCTGLFLKPSDFHKIGKLILNNGIYNKIQVVPEFWINEMCKLQLETPNAYKNERVFPKCGVGYYIFISREEYIFRDGTNGQYLILNRGKNLIISIMASEKEMNKITEVFRNLI